MKSSQSVDNFKRRALKTTQITKNIVIKASDYSTYFSLFLANSRGKDKLLSLFQYLFEFITTCGRHSNISGYQQAYHQMKLMNMVICYHLKQNISSARKVFRLFRFFDEIRGLTKIIKTNKPILFKILSVFTYSCSCCYYICDNTLWLVGILLKSNAVGRPIKRSFKQKKNMFSLCRVIAYLIILVYSIFLQSKENQGYLQKIQECQKQSDDSQKQNSNNFGKKLIQGRRKIRFFQLETVISILRFIMLTSSLKLKGYQYLDPIFVGVCGLISSILNFMKTIYEKKIVINLQKNPSQKSITMTKIEGRISGIKGW